MRSYIYIYKLIDINLKNLHTNRPFNCRCNISSRVAAIEKWTAVADICRCLHNFNGVLQVCAAFTNAAVYRLRKTWDKVPKTVSKHGTMAGQTLTTGLPTLSFCELLSFVFCLLGFQHWELCKCFKVKMRSNLV